MSTWDKLAPLEVEIESYELEGRELSFGEQFTRHTTLITLHGGGDEGVGEDVVYDGESTTSPSEAAADAAGRRLVDDRLVLRAHGRARPVPASRPCASVARATAAGPSSPRRSTWRLRQAGRSLAEQLGRELRPLTYVVSMRLGRLPRAASEPETSERMIGVLERYPGTRFKLDPTNTWSDELIEELAATGAVDSLDLKGQYKGTPVDVRPTPSCTRSWSRRSRTPGSRTPT